MLKNPGEGLLITGCLAGKEILLIGLYFVGGDHKQSYLDVVKMRGFWRLEGPPMVYR